jgi:hypothetical protein
MLKKIKVTSPVLFLFLFSISFLPLTQITEAEAQWNKKGLRTPIQKLPIPGASSIKKPTPGTLTDKQKQKHLGQIMKWNFDTPMEKLIERINYGIYNEVRYFGLHVDNIELLKRVGSTQTPGPSGGTVTLQYSIRNSLLRNLGCEAPSRNVNNGNANYEPLCGSLESYREMFRSNTLVIPFYAGYVSHKQLSFCGIDFEDIVTIPQDQIGPNTVSGEENRRAMQQSPISIKLRSLGKEFGTCFCKFGSRQGTHPSQGYENIVPDDYSNVCPL